VRYHDLPDADFVPSGSLLHFDRAPRPAAAQLFANRILTREGQTLLAGSLQTNSARTDVPAFQADETGCAGASVPPRGARYDGAAGRASAANSRMRARHTSSPARQNPTARRSAPNRPARVATSAVPVDASRSS
jgi:hypothetical protein